MNVAWALFWGGSRGTKPRVFPCKVASAVDERYLVRAALQPFVPVRAEKAAKSLDDQV